MDVFDGHSRLPQNALQDFANRSGIINHQNVRFHGTPLHHIHRIERGIP
jgi:hypothetical protein